VTHGRTQLQLEAIGGLGDAEICMRPSGDIARQARSKRVSRAPRSPHLVGSICVPRPGCPFSIICVFNDAPVREQCLDSSIERHRSEVDDLDYVVVDNRDGAFPSAGAALNVGALRARHAHLVFVHQDVVLHSMTALERAAAILEADHGIGLVGAFGVERGGRVVGRVRDRVVLLGERTDGPVDVDSIDEVLFIVPRRVFDRERLSEAPAFAWHGYAVEYGLRLRQDGLRVCSVDVPLTHNSLSINIEHLEVAYAELARAYSGLLPVRTPSRIITRWALARRLGRLIPRHAWRIRWLGESVAAHVGRRALKGARCVLGDIRWCIDDLLAGGADPLLIVNLDREEAFVDDRPDPLVLKRLEHELRVTSGGLQRAIASIRTAPAGASVLVSGLRVRDLRALAPYLSNGRPLLGFRREVGYWLLVGPSVGHVAARLRSQRSTPFGMGRDIA
jgi:glycosyl transferase family 2